MVLELENSRTRERNLISDFEKQTTELKKKESLLSNGQRQVEHLNSQKEDLLREIKDLRAQLSSTKSEGQDGFTKSIKLQEKLNNSEIVIADLKDMYQAEQRNSQNLQEEIKILTIEVNQNKARIQDLEGSNK